MVVVDLSWNIGMDSDNWRWSAATTSAAGELWVKVDSEPDDPDVNEAITSRWDGSKTEQCELTGLGISVWGVSVSWDNDDDEWGDAPDAGDPVTNTWAGTMTNNDHGTYVDSVYLRVYSSASAAVSASDRPYGGECMVCNSVNQLSLSLIP